MPPATSADLRALIAARLAACASATLGPAARDFFAALGYTTNRASTFTTLDEFFTTFDPERKGVVKAGADTRDWRSIPLLLQFTNDDIARASGGQLNPLPGSFNGKAIESYLFLTLQLRDRPEGYTRVDLAHAARALNKLFRMPVLVLFQHGASLTLAHVERRENKLDRSRDVVTPKVALLKDIDCRQPHAAHLRILEELALPSLAAAGRRTGTALETYTALDSAWQRVLSTRELNTRFYKEIADWYQWAVGSIRLPFVAPHLRGTPEGEDENRKQFVIRLLCRTLFCWFLKERRLIDPRLLELHDAAGHPIVLFNRPADETPAQFAAANHYYRGILQNIFFNCLNAPMGERRHSAARAREDRTVRDPELKKFAYRGKAYLPATFDYAGLLDRIPYLNGGLFDVLEEDNASDTIDDAAIAIPNRLFYATEADRETVTIHRKIRPVTGLNVILARYKFTITENSPLEEEVALDPELLGLVFENLLAEVDANDASASESARKASGSFYTPRRVIDYMVNEALRLHLENFVRPRGATADEIAALTELLYRSKWDMAKHPRLAPWVVDAFDQLRLLDPACGSGAFPMGALHRMVEVLRVVDSGNLLWLERQLARLPGEMRPAARRQLASAGLFDYSRKLGLIKNALYGIDIQPLAVLITKLRFFISLLADQRLDLADPAHNYGLTPLPNLETKILCADTLREVAHDLFARDAVRAYQAARDEYYQPATTAARRAELVDVIAEQLSTVLPMFAEEVTGGRERTPALQAQRNRELLKEWFRHSTLPAPFFLFSVFFPEVCPEETPAPLAGELTLDGGTGQQEFNDAPAGPRATPAAGFDIVIGNPPYGGTDIKDEVKESLGLRSKDPYGAFIARFLRDGRAPTPLRADGILAYIVSDTFMTIRTHRPLRAQLMGSRVHKVIRVSGDTFNATVNTAILVVQKSGGPGTTAPTAAALAQAECTGPWCQMVDLTRVSIHAEHDRFLHLLFETAGSHRRADVSTESCAVYTYPQALIATNTNLPFFVASPKLFALMNDTTAPLTLREIGGRTVQVRTVTLNGRPIEVTKLEQIAEVKVGLQTGDNNAYLFQNAEARGNYRDIARYAQYLLTEADLRRIRENPALRADVVEHGISKDDPDSPRYFGGRYIAPYDKGGESDSEEGWMPNYHVPTDYFIDWDEEHAQCLIQSRLLNDTSTRPYPRNTDKYFRAGITYSPTGEYSPSFRFGGAGIFGNKGSTIFPHEGISVAELIGGLTSKAYRFLLKSYRAHTVESPEQGLLDTPLPLIFPRGLSELVGSISSAQVAGSSYDYASNEQIKVDQRIYQSFGFNRHDVAEVETWYARRYYKLIPHQRANLKRLGKLPPADRWNVYCDETGHLEHDHQPHLLLGALLVPRDRVRPLTLALRQRLLAAGLPQTKPTEHRPAQLIELKWTKVSPAGLRFYEAALDFFATEPDLRFRALVAPKSPPPPKLPRPPAAADDPGSPAWDAYHAYLEEHAPAAVDYLHRHEAWYYDRYFDLLRETLVPPSHHAIYVDVKDTRGGPRIQQLRERLADAHYDWTRSGVVEKVQQIESHDVLLDQLVDILLGALSWLHSAPTRNPGTAPSPAKQALAERVRALVATPSPGLLPKVIVEHSTERSPSA
jgi:hypothetical protein